MAAPLVGLTSTPRPDSTAATLAASSRSAIPPISVVAVHAGSKFPPWHFNGLRASVHQRKLSSALFVDTARAVRQAIVVCEAQETIEVPDVTKATWKSLVIDCDKAVIVEFWASWCEPCRTIGPVISKLAVKYDGMMRFLRLNTDENSDIATQYGVRSIPTVVIFKNGEKMEKVIGSVPEKTLINFIEGYLDG